VFNVINLLRKLSCNASLYVCISAEQTVVTLVPYRTAASHCMVHMKYRLVNQITRTLMK